MNETPIKAGKNKDKTKKGRMKQGYCWPMFGEQIEIVFIYADSRARYQIEKILSKQFSGTLLTDGYGAYAAYCQANELITHAQCWPRYPDSRFIKRRFDKTLCV